MATRYNEIGGTGLGVWGGHIREEFLADLNTAAKAYKRYNEMRLNCPVAGALLLAIEQAIRGVTWSFISETGPDDPRIAFLEAARDHMSNSWNDVISDALTMLPFGFALQEIVYRKGGDKPGDPPELRGKVTWRKFAPRGQDTVYRWLLDDAGGIQGVVQWANNKQIEIPIEKLILYRTRIEKNNPEGRSIFRTAYTAYYFWKNLSAIEAIGVERDLAGLPVIILPPGASTDEDDTNSDAAKAAKVVRNLRNDEQAGVVLPEGWELKLLSTGSGRAFDTDQIISRYESRILMSALAQFLLLGQDKVGTQALSQDQTDFFNMSVNATADILAETFSAYAIPRLLELNGFDVSGIQLEHSIAGDVDMMTLADFLQKVGAFLTWTADDEIWLRSAAKMPEIDAETIEAEREEKAQRAADIAARFTPRQDDGEEEDEDEAEMGAVVYAAKRPFQRERDADERTLKRAIAKMLDFQRRKSIKAARDGRANA